MRLASACVEVHFVFVFSHAHTRRNDYVDALAGRMARVYRDDPPRHGDWERDLLRDYAVRLPDISAPTWDTLRKINDGERVRPLIPISKLRLSFVAEPVILAARVGLLGAGRLGLLHREADNCLWCQKVGALGRGGTAVIHAFGCVEFCRTRQERLTPLALWTLPEEAAQWIIAFLWKWRTLPPAVVSLA